MTLYTNNAEGGANGSAVATTDTGSGTAFTDVVPGTGGTITYATAAAQKGGLGYAFVAAASNSCYVDWVNLAGAANTGYALRAYVYVPTLPTANSQPLFTLRSAGGGTGILTFQLGTTGTGSHLFVTEDGNAGATLTGSTTTFSFAAATWYRIEVQGSNASSTTGVLNIQVYAGDSATAVSGGTIALSAINYFSTATIGTVRWGRAAAIGSAFNLNMDDLAFQTASTTPIGASTAGPTTGSGSFAGTGAGTLTASGAPAPSTTVVLTSLGSLAAHGGMNQTGTVAFTGAGALSAAPSVGFNGVGALTVAGTPGGRATVTLTGAGALTATPGPPAIAAPVPLGSSGLLLVSGYGATYTFVGPVILEVRPLRVEYPRSLLTQVVPYGESVWQDADGVWHQQFAPSWDQLQGAQVVYSGGREYNLGADEAAALRAAGFGQYVIKFPPDPIGLVGDAVVGTAIVG